MSSILTLRPHYHFPHTLPSSISLLNVRFSLSSSFSSKQTQTLALEPPRHLNYGPSLFKGRPNHNPNSGQESAAAETGSIDRSHFSRVFDISTLRVPAAECAALERRLRGHLLNWPRVRNVARVEGDDVDPHLKSLLKNPSAISEERLDLLVRRSDAEEEAAFSPVLYREKLVKDFNCRGYVKFRNLAKISRPKKKKKKQRNEDGVEVEVEVEREDKRGKNEIYFVEVVDDEEVEDWGVLIGEEFKGRTWRGPTRILLLDERYAKKGMDEMPEAVKAVLVGGTVQNRQSIIELVQCRLTLYYDYWQMNELLEALLPDGTVIPTGFETVGHIAHLNLRDEHLPYKKLIAQVVLEKNTPRIQTVVNKMDAIQHDYRTMELEVLTGNHSLVTTVIENGIRFQVDLAAVYWNSRLATERQRLVSFFSNSDVVCDVFSGVGPIAISAAKKVKYVYANDLNPNAVDYLERNIVLNKLDRKIEIVFEASLRSSPMISAARCRNFMSMDSPRPRILNLISTRGLTWLYRRR